MTRVMKRTRLDLFEVRRTLKSDFSENNYGNVLWA